MMNTSNGDNMNIWKFRLWTFIKMFHAYNGISCIKMGIWFVLRKLLGKSDKGELGRIYIKKLKKSIWIRKYNKSDYGLLIDFFVNDAHEKGGHYNFPEIDKYSDIRFILDGGSNIGLFSLLYANKYPNSFIIAVEPEDANFRALKKNSELNDNIHVVKGGLWNRKAYLAIQNKESHSTGFYVGEVDKEEDSDIKAFSIQDIKTKYLIDSFDVIKLDIEGSEFPIFMDDNCEEWLKGTRFVIMEIHDKHMKNGRQMIYKRMKSCGFTHINYNGDELFINTQM